jgi:hypothetical protein
MKNITTELDVLRQDINKAEDVLTHTLEEPHGSCIWGHDYLAHQEAQANLDQALAAKRAWYDDERTQILTHLKYSPTHDVTITANEDGSPLTRASLATMTPLDELDEELILVAS